MSAPDPVLADRAQSDSDGAAGGVGVGVGPSAPASVDGCVFCAIVAGDIPAEVVGMNEMAVAFRDLHPIAPSHVLVIPRDHLDDAATVTSRHGGVLAEMLLLAHEAATRDGVDESGYRLVMNVGPDSGNSVGHLHMHVLGGRPLGALG